MHHGRDQAFSAFMAARYPSLLRTAILLAGTDGSGAEDLVQEALLRTYRAWRRIGRAEAAEAYTRTTMVRLLAKNRRRRWNREVPAAALPEVPGPGHDEDVATALAVRALLRRLPPGQRAVLVLRFYHQLTERQIAEVLGCSVGTVKSRAARALTALRASGLLLAVPDRETGPG
ncbi:SigE family RNA polymerase sigma factor [Streptomyces sp. MST-110588]|uniref:SigE family RNA polymerase sigma factor n=1 Tax=Streptomyces sp. MST-110588 TaxID=2833628 RepID=UPI00204CF863|nr:SigE family RNA polymerase sigma factor [Streptomyces sp. MST-110588]UNO38520.1 SigE family RNA polymerase sigma factor [Streptomyces sp. MST-110588]